MNIRLLLRGLGAAWLFTLACPAAAQLPPAPTLTAGAAGIKQLRFDWEPVPRANYYELWHRAEAGAGWTKVREIPGHRSSAVVNAAIHLAHWQEARYRLAACNASGCRPSAAIAVATALSDAIGYFKKVPLATGDGFPAHAELSQDGRTLVASADNSSQATASGTPSLYVYRRVQGEWQFDARLLPDLAQSGSGFDMDVAVSADGTVIAMGNRSEDLPGSDPEEFGDIGAVYVYRRGPGGWQLEQKLQILPARYGESFGSVVKLNDAGDMLAVLRATGGVELSSGSIEIYAHANGTWTRSAIIPTLRGQGEGCNAFGLSGDGSRIVRHCSRGFSDNDHADMSVFDAPGWTLSASFEVAHRSGFDVRDVAISRNGRTFAYRTWEGERPFVDIHREGAEGWIRTAHLTHGEWTPAPGSGELSRYGEALSMSADGRMLAVADQTDAGDATGVVAPPLATSWGSGAVYLYQREPAEWINTRIVKRQPHENVGAIGRAISLARNGRSLAVGSADNGSSEGVGGDPDLQTHPVNTGAVWLY